MSESWEWDEFRSLVEERFAKAQGMDSQDAPFPLCGHEASLWLRCKRETLQWVSEMMPERSDRHTVAEYIERVGNAQ